MKEYSKKEAYSRATALCSKSEKCISDIRKKLYDWELDAEEHDVVIDALIDNKYIDEERFATYYVRDKYRFNGWGRVKIRHNLSQKQVPSYLIDEAMEEIDSEVYDEKLQHALSIKKRSIKTEDNYERRHKLMRFAAGRGFSLDEINKALDKLAQD
ncbi:MAG: regulatory protein RecX [Bacteroidales bacterium]|jgi:regulatory protein|nr:regulatory protein RecX [Bacteroidales bacterium]